ncbi:5'-3' exonuclease [Terriglobus roseus]|uniref:5'-3' exonuclease n=1 Tax=Terriglobus roseus TaxID=392734 RepID=A0A1G7PKP2_9BACT|nr:5'-3' exonuclease H3TH domain-containing protein [Terriglobus roseus]SDF86714.1 5'-3' exonuclease [Terriglobus roseus]
MEVHLIDGTYELFRHFYAWPSMRDANGNEIGAVKGVLASILAMVKEGATHIGVATDHVIESFRNDLWPGYKTGAGIDPDLWSQFPLLEEALQAMGIVTWAMENEEADDALASAAHIAAQDARVTRVLICTPDKDLSQCVQGTRVVQMDRRKREIRDEAGVIAKFGVPPASIPDYLALVGDTADGYPGLRGWGAKGTAAVLAKFSHLEAIPQEAADWQLAIANPRGMNETLRTNWDNAILFRTLARLKTDLPLFTNVDQLHWTGPTAAFEAIGTRLDKAKVTKSPKQR